MAKNYDNYGYDDEYSNRTSLIRRILIVIMIIIAIILLIYLIKGCSNGKLKPANKINTGFNYEESLLKAGKDYFDTNAEEQPNAVGECSVVELQTLMDKNLLDKEKFGSCNLSTTYVKLCLLEDGTKHYTPWLTCVNKNSDKEYGAIKEGTESDIVANKTYVEFKFMPVESQSGEDILGPVEELWKSDIKYDAYKTLATTTYYRYRDKYYIWNLTKRSYYTSTGIKNDSASAKEYYPSSPSTGYNLKSNKATAYKWYTATATREYYMKDGAKMPSLNAVGEYNIKDPNGINVTRYRTRTITGTYNPTMYYVCSTSASSPILKYQTKKCGTGSTPEYKYQREIIYSCASGNDLIRANQVSGPSVKCNKYSEWSSPTSTKCNTSQSNICQSVTVTFYYWYKNVNEVRTYYPSGSKSASGEKVYYTAAPVANAVKDTKTATTAYKWYKESKSKSNDFTVLPPKGYFGTKTSEYKWGDWSSWSTKNPKINDGRDRSIEKKVKIKLQEIKGKNHEGWQSISDSYLTEKEIITLYQEKGYKVNTLEDIVNNGKLRYQVKMFVRNKKESN